MNLGKAIKEMREAAGLTLEQMEQKSGRRVAYLEKIETGQATPDNGDMRSICEAINVPKELLPMLALEETDVKEDRKEMYKILYPSVRELALSLITKTE